MAKVAKIYTVRVSTQYGPSETYFLKGTLEELIKKCEDILEKGHKRQNIKGGKKIILQPKNIKSLVINLNKAAENEAGAYLATYYYDLVEERNNMVANTAQDVPNIKVKKTDRELELELASLDGMLAHRNKQNPFKSSYHTNKDIDPDKYSAYIEGYTEAFNEQTGK